MLKPQHRIEVFSGRNGFYWRARHLKTSKIVADGSEPYSTKSNARRAARRIGRVLIFAPVVDIKEEARTKRHG
jgi:hypothetical protein